MDHTKELIALAHDGSKEARDILVLENMGLVYSIARRFAGRGYEMEDINQIGTIGLIKAIDKFDLEQPVMFSTYAVPMISGEIKRFIRDDGIIKVSRTIKDNNRKINMARERILKETGRDDYAICTEVIKKKFAEGSEQVLSEEPKSTQRNRVEEITEFALDLLEGSKDLKSAMNMLLMKVGKRFRLSAVSVREYGNNDIPGLSYLWSNMEPPKENLTERLWHFAKAL